MIGIERAANCANKSATVEFGAADTYKNIYQTEYETI